MKAAVWHDIGKISVDEVADPVLGDPAFKRGEPGWAKVALELSG